MSDERIYIDGELFLSLEAVARLYEVRVVWLQEVCESGLLSDPPAESPILCIASVELDRVATIVRLHHNLDMDLDSIALALE